MWKAQETQNTELFAAIFWKEVGVTKRDTLDTRHEDH